jgi:tetratricopeptide (TPR) repeat protein
MSAVLRIRQRDRVEGFHPIGLRLTRPDAPDLEAETRTDFALTPQEQEDLRWYLEDWLQVAAHTAPVHAEQIEALMRAKGEALYDQVLDADRQTRAIWYAVRERLADLRIEIQSSVTGAAAIPWELLRDPQSDSAIALRVRAFVRVQPDPNLSFCPHPSADDGRLRLLYVVCRPSGTDDVELRAIANRLLRDLGPDRPRFAVEALRPPTFEQLQAVLTQAKAAGRPYHICHFDGHGCFADLTGTPLAAWLHAHGGLKLGAATQGPHGYLLFEHPESPEGYRPVGGAELGQLLHDAGCPVLILNACQSAMHTATAAPAPAPQGDQAGTVHDERRAIGSLAQAVADQGIPAVLGMRYSVYVVTAAQYIGALYAALARGQGFGQAASEARKHLSMNPERWIGLEPRPLQDWLVPVIYEAQDRPLLLAPGPAGLGLGQDTNPVLTDPMLRLHCPDQGFIGRDETLLMLDRAFDRHRICLLHAYAGQGKTTTAVEFARWYAETGGLGSEPLVLFTSFEGHRGLDDLLDQVAQAQPMRALLAANGLDWYAVPRDSRRGLVLQLLRALPVLWIWDNLEPVAGFPAGSESAWTDAEQADLKDFLKQIALDDKTRARLLLTSRRDERAWLGDLPYRVRMPPMSMSDSAALALRLAASGAEGRGLDRATIGADWPPLLDYCAGNPLTLRVLVGQALRLGLRGRERIAAFVQSIRDGESRIADTDAAEGRDRSLGASLDYGFAHAFTAEELPVIALLHLFQGVAHVGVLGLMGEGEEALPTLEGQRWERLAGLLGRAAEIGIATPLNSVQFGIHPALPWFLRQVFERHYDGREGRPAAENALRAWVAAIGILGDHYARAIFEGRWDRAGSLAMEESNLLHARRIGRRVGLWGPVIGAMQGLRSLYDYQGRGAEWARLVEALVPDYCTADAGPVPGREDDYRVVMEYRVRLAQDRDRDLDRAADLQSWMIDWDRTWAAEALALPPDAPLDAEQRNRIRTLGVSVAMLAHLLRDRGDPACADRYRETIGYHRRIGDTPGEANGRYNLGRAYAEVPAIRDLDAAESAYCLSLALRDPNDALGRSACIKQIGMVHHARFREAHAEGSPKSDLLRHARAAESAYLEALALCPAGAVDRGPMHNELGNLYDDVGQTQRAREHYENAIRIHDRTGDCYGAGQTRFNLALLYRQSAEDEPTPYRRRDLLRRAEAYAQTALEDFRHYQRRAADWEARAQQLIDLIAQALAAVPT